MTRDLPTATGGDFEPGEPAARGPRAPRRWSLSSRVTLTIGAAVVVPILGAAVAFTERSQTGFRTAVTERIQGAARRLCAAADVHLEKHRTAIVALSGQLRGARLVPSDTLHLSLANAHRVYPGFLTMLIAAADGTVVGAAPRKTPDGADVLARLTSVADREYFAVPMRDRTVFVSDVFLGRGFGVDPIVAISAPIEDDAGRVAGIVEGSLDVHAITALAGRAAGEQDVTFVVVDRGRRVIASNHTPALPVLSAIDDGPLVRAAEAHGDAPAFEYRAARTAGREPEPRQVARCATAEGWTVFAMTSLAPIDAEGRRLYAMALGWTAAALAAALAVAAAIARSVTRPIDTLSTAVRTFHPHGALPSIVSTGTEPGEIAVLIERFNEMARRVNEADRTMHGALDESRRAQAELAHVLGQRDREVRERTAELAARTEQLAAANARLEELASTDPLTGIANRRAFLAALDVCLRAAAREAAPVALLALDVDFFKNYNDALGHPAGDECLRKVAGSLHAIAQRPLDRVGRVGGEEFAIALHGTPPESAALLAERARTRIESLRLAHPSSPLGHVTVSVGVASVVPGAQTTAADLIEAADHALYRAKRAGRNTVAMADWPPAAHPPLRAAG